VKLPPKNLNLSHCLPYPTSTYLWNNSHAKGAQWLINELLIAHKHTTFFLLFTIAHAIKSRLSVSHMISLINELSPKPTLKKITLEGKKIGEFELRHRAPLNNP